LTSGMEGREGMDGRDDIARRLADSEERHRLLAEHANDVIWTMSLDGRITYLSPAVERLRGFTVAEAMAQSIDEIHPPESRDISLAYFARLAELLSAGLPAEEFHGELEYRCKDGSTIWCDVQVIPHLDADGRPVEILGVSRDITERRRYEEELRRAHAETEAANRALQEANEHLAQLAVTDALTGCWNRRHLEEAAHLAHVHRTRYEVPAAMLVIDIDHFKRVNDTLGHLAGDDVLREVVDVMRPRLRAADVLARWGGEEFAVLLPHTTGSQASALAEDLRALVASSVLPHDVALTISVGVAELRIDDSVTTWLERADHAMYAAKEAGRDAVRRL